MYRIFAYLALIFLYFALASASSQNFRGQRGIEYKQLAQVKQFITKAPLETYDDGQHITDKTQKMLLNNDLMGGIVSTDQQDNINNQIQFGHGLQVRRFLNQIPFQETAIQNVGGNQNTQNKTGPQSEGQSLNIFQLNGGEVLCGNAKIDGDQQCNDGNSIEGDGCNNMCQHQKGLSTALIVVIVVIPTVLLILAAVLIIRYCYHNRQAVSEIKVESNQVASDQALPEVTNKQSIVLS